MLKDVCICFGPFAMKFDMWRVSHLFQTSKGSWHDRDPTSTTRDSN